MKEDYTDGSYYLGTVGKFMNEAWNSGQITSRLEAMHEYYDSDLELNIQQVRAWKSSVEFLKWFLREFQIRGEQVIALEAMLKEIDGRRERIDVLLCGRDGYRNDQVELMELKTWHTSRKKKYGRRRYDIEANDKKSSLLYVTVLEKDLTTGADKVVYEGEKENIRIQAHRYLDGLQSPFREMYEVDQMPNITAAGVLYRCTKLSQKVRAALAHNIHPDIVASIPIITQKGCEGSWSLKQYGEDLARRMAAGSGMEVYERIGPALQRTILSVDEKGQYQDVVADEPEPTMKLVQMPNVSFWLASHVSLKESLSEPHPDEQALVPKILDEQPAMAEPVDVKAMGQVVSSLKTVIAQRSRGLWDRLLRATGLR